jgi:hypothetical protein
MVPTADVAEMIEKMMIASFTEAKRSQILSEKDFFFSSVMQFVS